MKTVEIVYRYTDAAHADAARPDSPAAARARL